MVHSLCASDRETYRTILKRTPTTQIHFCLIPLNSTIHLPFLTNCANFTEDPIGQGGDLALSACTTGFDNMKGCTIHGSTFINSHTARKGGSVQVSNGVMGASYVEFNGCSFLNASAGSYIEDDPQGEGGVFSVGSGNTLVVVDTVVADAYAGKKVRSNLIIQACS